jgi:hypothetical protein
MLNACRQALLLGEAPSTWRSLRPLVALSLVPFWLAAVRLRREERPWLWRRESAKTSPV